jgi:hypothetical protein
MNAARWVLGLSTSFAVCASVATGCGGNQTPATIIDSGASDVTTEAAVEAAAETGPEAAPEAAVDAACVPDANLSTLTLPDAAIGDSGGNEQACSSCFQGACSMLITMCDQTCACVSAFQAFLACATVNTDGTAGLVTCAETSGLASVQGFNIMSAGCAIGCVNVCGVTLPSGDGGGGDTGTTSDSGTAGDGASE